MLKIEKNTLLFWALLVLFSLFVMPIIFDYLVFPDLPSENVPSGRWFLLISLFCCTLLLNYAMRAKFILMLFSDSKKTASVMEDEDSLDEELSKTKVNYLLFPIGFFVGFLYGGIVAMRTSGLIFFDGGIRLALVATFFISIIFVLVKGKVITLWLFEKQLDDLENKYPNKP